MLIYFTTFQTSFRKISTIITIILILLFKEDTFLKNTKNIKFNNTILTFFLTIQCFTLYNYINISVDNELQDTEKDYYVEKY